MKLNELVTYMHLSPHQAIENIKITSIEQDSRKVQKNSLFVAILGSMKNSHNGHHFLQEAISQGACALVIQNNEKAPTHCPIPVFHVPDTALFLAVACEAFYGFPSHHLEIVGITGTSGKSSTTFLLQAISEAEGKKAAVFGTLGIGDPKELSYTGFTTPPAEQISKRLSELLQQGYQRVFMEISSHALQSKRAHGLYLHAAAFTNLTPEHLDFHGTLEAYANAKAKLFFELLPKEKPAILPQGHPWAEPLSKDHPVMTWSAESREASVHVLDTLLDATGVKGKLSLNKKIVDFKSKWVGDFNLDNILCAAACALGIGIPPEKIIEGIWKAQPVKGRLEPIRIKENHNLPCVIVDYAHKPDAMERILQTARTLTQGRLIIVFGCGGNRDTLKRPVMGKIASDYGSLVILTDDNPRYENPMDIRLDILKGIPKEAMAYTLEIGDRKMAISTAIELAKSEDLVMILGKGHETMQEIQGVTTPFDDGLVAQEALLKRANEYVI